MFSMQVGVAIGLALQVKHGFSELRSVKKAEIDSSVTTSIIATRIFFEILGQILPNIALMKAE
jgi:hypothetical protein